jgi:hypothetical protein
MLHRFSRIRNEFGNKDLAKVVFLLAVLAAMSLAGYFLMESPWSAVVAVGGLVLGWLLRGTIVDHMETLFRVAPKFFLVYGIVLGVGQLLGLSREGQLIMMCANTVVLFNIQFWPLSDPSIINIEKAGMDR